MQDNEMCSKNYSIIPAKWKRAISFSGVMSDFNVCQVGIYSCFKKTPATPLEVFSESHTGCSDGKDKSATMAFYPPWVRRNRNAL